MSGVKYNGRDASLKQVEAHLASWHLEKFQNFVEPIDVSKVFDPSSGREKKGKFQLGLGVDEDGHSEIVRVGYFTDVERVHIKVKTRSLDFGRYLDQLVKLYGHSNDTANWGARRLYDKQWSWWTKNGKVFPFLKLPAELREKIYEDLFTTDMDLHLRDVRPHPRLPWRSRMHFLRAKSPIPGMGVLKLNHSIFEEASEVFYRNVNFVAETMPLLRLLQEHPSLERIQNLTLDFSHHDYLQLFGMTRGEQKKIFGTTSNDHITRELSNEATALRLSHLRLLRFNIRSPYSMSLDSRLKDAYHNDVVRLILVKALRCTRGHPVVLSGYADDYQVLKFRAAIEVSRKQYEAWYLACRRWGGCAGSLDEYDEWAAEEDGGVRVDGRDKDPPPSYEQLLAQTIAEHETRLNEGSVAGLMAVNDDEPKGFN